jgi:phosphoribosyl-ATP pyrophosphohydrolase/phosphoribosyl-AMP cyclohydrolase
MDFSKLQGLVPAVIQDAESGEVLMVGFMNEEALAVTQRTGYATFYSRTRERLWTKGETSGNRLQVVRALIDCDDDSVLLQVKRLGDGNVCHTGERSCFYRELSGRPKSTDAPGGAPNSARTDALGGPRAPEDPSRSAPTR